MINRLRALGSFEFHVTKELKCEPTTTEWVTAPNHEKILDRLRVLVSVEYAVISDFKCESKDTVSTIKRIKGEIGG